MQTYPQIAQAYLKKNNPQELKRLKEEGKLEEFLQDVEEVFGDQETEIIQRMSKNLPENFLERARSLNQAKMVARDRTRSDLTEFLVSL